MTEHTDHAIVVGASMGGLLAARALSEVYGNVTVVERDVLEAGPVARRGVPQGRHAHGLLARGREVLEDFFPGLTDELIGHGAATIDLQAGFRWINGGRLLRQEPSGLLGLGVSRLLLEACVRARVLALPSVRLLDGCDATGLAATSDRRRVTGLRVLRRAGDARRRRCRPTWSSTRPDAGHAGRSGWRSSATRRPPWRRSTSAWRTRRGPTAATRTRRSARPSPAPSRTPAAA